MNTTTLAILGLFFWLWSHEGRHLHEEKGGRWRLVFYGALSVVSSILLIDAAITAVWG